MFHIPIIRIVHQTFPGIATKSVQVIFSLILAFGAFFNGVKALNDDSNQTIVIALFLLFWTVIVSLPVKNIIAITKLNES